MARSPRRAVLDSSTAYSAGMETKLMRDEGLITTHMLKEFSVLPNQLSLQYSDRLPHQHSEPPHTFFPFNIRGAGDYVESMLVARNAASACGTTMQAIETMKRPLYWPFLYTERVKRSLSPDCNVGNEQSGSTSEFCNMSNTAMVERMLSNEEVDMNFNEGESRIRKKKRLTGDQVHALESSFEADKKLEAERKQELAKRLSLEPRQVAVWFQNRRARSKTKHLERDFALLKSKYHSILAETHKLRSEVSRLTAELEATKGEAAGAKTGTSTPEIRQLAPNALLQNPGSNHYNSTRNIVKSSNVVMEAAHILHESSTLLSERQGNYLVINSVKQNTSNSPSISCVQDKSHNNLVEGDYTTSPACISDGNQHNYIEHAPCSDLVACLIEANTTRLENVDTNCSSLAAYLRKVNASFSDNHKLQANHDDCLQPLSLWELTA